MLYHIVCPAKYRKKIFTDSVEITLKEICIGIGERYEIYFVEIGSDEDHVHFLVQSVPMMLPSHMVQTIKSITAMELFKQHPEIKKLLWGGALWTTGYYINTVGQYGNETVIKEYVKNQGKQYRQIYRGQLQLFD
jgi:putative transposase